MRVLVLGHGQIELWELFSGLNLGRIRWFSCLVRFSTAEFRAQLFLAASSCIYFMPGLWNSD